MRTRNLLGAAAVVAALIGASTPDATASGISMQESSYPTAHGDEQLTVYRPDGYAGPRPGLVLVHGGAWVGGKRDLLDPIARAAAERGFVAITIDYSLAAPRAPRQYQDVGAAIRHIHDRAADFGIDPGRIGGLGTSAGAHLMMQALVTEGSPLAAAAGWSGPYDLTARDTPRNALVATYAAVVYLGCAPLLPDCAQQAAQSSPALHTTPDSPPILLFNAQDELMPIEQMTSFATRLRAQGTEVTTHVVPGKGHAIAYTGLALTPTLDFFAERL